MKKIGPPLPPHLEKKRASQRLQQEQQREQEREQERERDVKVIKGCALPEPSSARHPTLIGPTFPSSSKRTHSEESDEQDESDSDSDSGSEEEGIIGPVPTTTPFSEEMGPDAEWVQLQQSINERAKRMEEKHNELLNPAVSKLERGEWMMVPPTSRSINELQSLKPRKFSSKSSKSEFDPTWTQVPQTGQPPQVTGSSSEYKKVPSATHGSNKKRQRSPPALAASTSRDRELSAMVAEYNAHHRGMSLMEMHESNPKHGKRLRQHEKEAASRPFDREKDLAGRPALSSSKIMELRQQASKMSDKFGHGKTQFL